MKTDNNSIYIDDKYIKVQGTQDDILNNLSQLVSSIISEGVCTEDKILSAVNYGIKRGKDELTKEMKGDLNHVSKCRKQFRNEVKRS